MKKILIFLACIAFVGCKQIKYVEVEKIHTDSVFVHTTDTIKENIFLYIEKTDSVHEREYTDSLGVVHNDKEHFYGGVVYRDREKEVIHDSIFVEAKVDSIPYKVEVEKELTKCVQVKVVFGEIFLYVIGAAILSLIALAVYYKVKR